MPQIPKVAAAITAAALVIGLGILVFQLQSIKKIGEIQVTKTVDLVVAQDDESCSWELEFELENTTDIPLNLEHVRAAIQRSSPTSGRVIEDQTGFDNDILNPNATTVARLTFELDDCPPDSSEIKHDLLRVIYSSRDFGNRTQTARF